MHAIALRVNSRKCSPVNTFSLDRHLSNNSRTKLVLPFLILQWHLVMHSILLHIPKSLIPSTWSFCHNGEWWSETQEFWHPVHCSSSVHPWPELQEFCHEWTQTTYQSWLHIVLFLYTVGDERAKRVRDYSSVLDANGAVLSEFAEHSIMVRAFLAWVSPATFNCFSFLTTLLPCPSIHIWFSKMKGECKNSFCWAIIVCEFILGIIIQLSLIICHLT